ncbi:MAG: hypothetical protein QXQ70_09595 [Candidatus Caldarchaeum sp.]
MLPDLSRIGDVVKDCHVRPECVALKDHSHASLLGAEEYVP